MLCHALDEDLGHHESVTDLLLPDKMTLHSLLVMDIETISRHAVIDNLAAVLDARVLRVRGRTNGSAISVSFPHGSTALEEIVWRI